MGGRHLGEVEVPQTEAKPTEASSFPAAQTPPDTLLISSRLAPAGLQAAGGVGREKQAQERKRGGGGGGASLLVDSPSAGCCRSSIPKDPTHCLPGVGGKTVTFRREVKRQSTLPPITLRHKAQDFSSKGVPPVPEQENTDVSREQGASTVLARC